MSLRNCFVLAISLTSLAFLIACGSSGNSVTPPPSGAFGNSNFNGSYTFSVAGVDVNGPVSIAGVVTSSGNGTFSGGTVDYVDPAGPPFQNAVGSNSVYSVTKDGRATARLFLTPSGGTQFEVDFDFVLSSSNHGLITRFDGNGTGSGTIDTTASGATFSAGAYSFSVSGSTLSGSSLSGVGAVTLDASGNINTAGANAGIADFTVLGNFPATVYQAQTVSGSITEGAPGAASLTIPALGSLTFDVFAVDSTHAKVIENDGLNILVGDLYTQGTDAIPASGLVFSTSGLDGGSNLFVTGGTVTSDGSSTLTGGLQDVNDDGIIDGGGTTISPASFSGTFAESPVGSGRFVVTMSNFFGGTTFMAYPSTGGILLLESDTNDINAGIEAGIALTQASGAALGSTQGFGMNLTGEDVVNVANLDEIAQFNTSGSTTVQTGNIDQNDFSLSQGGSLSLGTAGIGTGTITAGSGGAGLITFNGSGLAGVLYYAADSTTSLVISADPNQATLGSMTVQSTPTDDKAQVVERHVAMLRATSAVRKNAKRSQNSPAKH